MTATLLNQHDFLPNTPLRERVVVVVLVLALHAGVMRVWLMQPQPPSVAVGEMSVSIAMRPAVVAQAQPEPPRPQPRIARSEKPLPKQPVREAETAPQPAVEVPSAPMLATPPAEAAASVIDSAPDYRAAYLNNPRPPYPMVARRMGWEGRVVLNVEVLAEGSCGDINVHQSSGHEVLDNAALRTVKGWRFLPARRAGQPVTQWFKVPIRFSLKENEA